MSDSPQGPHNPLNPVDIEYQDDSSQYGEFSASLKENVHTHDNRDIPRGIYFLERFANYWNTRNPDPNNPNSLIIGTLQWEDDQNHMHPIAFDMTQAPSIEEAFYQAAWSVLKYDQEPVATAAFQPILQSIGDTPSKWQPQNIPEHSRGGRIKALMGALQKTDSMDGANNTLWAFTSSYLEITVYPPQPNNVPKVFDEVMELFLTPYFGTPQASETFKSKGIHSLPGYNTPLIEDFNDATFDPEAAFVGAPNRKTHLYKLRHVPFIDNFAKDNNDPDYHANHAYILIGGIDSFVDPAAQPDSHDPSDRVFLICRTKAVSTTPALDQVLEGFNQDPNIRAVDLTAADAEDRLKNGFQHAKEQTWDVRLRYTPVQDSRDANYRVTNRLFSLGWYVSGLHVAAGGQPMTPEQTALLHNLDWARKTYHKRIPLGYTDGAGNEHWKITPPSHVPLNDWAGLVDYTPLKLDDVSVSHMPAGPDKVYCERIKAGAQAIAGSNNTGIGGL